MPDSLFIDTNILVYALLEHEQARHDQAVALLTAMIGQEVFVSTQVLSEVYVALAKNGIEHDAIAQYLNELEERCKLATKDFQTITRCLALKKRYDFSYWDSLILAAALECGCATLYSEDMQHGQVIERTLTIRNPFADSADFTDLKNLWNRRNLRSSAILTVGSFMQRTYIYWFSAGCIIGVLLAFALKGVLRDMLVQPVRFDRQDRGETRRTTTAVVLSQAGKPVGYLKQGTRILFEPQGESGARVQLWLGWENDGTYSQLFLPSADDGTPIERKALATLAKRERL